MSAQKLKKAPLQEVIFELFWDGIEQDNQIKIDPGYENAVGKFQERVQDQTPIQIKLLPQGVVFPFFNYPALQYWAGEKVWPVFQHGPGFLSINETEKNYVWDGYYRELIQQIVGKLVSSYSSNPIKFSFARLRYIDAIDLGSESATDFIAKNFQISLDAQFKGEGELTGFSFSRTYKVEDESFLQIQVNTSENSINKQPALVWITAIEQKKGKYNPEEVFQWLELAHEKCSQTFKALLKPAYYASLDQ